MPQQIQYGGEIHEFPDDFTGADIQAALTPAKSVGGFISNIGSSGAKLVGDAVSALTNPATTLEAIGAVPVGIYEKLGGPTPANWDRSSAKMLDAMLDHYKERYGSIEGAKEALYNDPVGVVADFSALASAVGIGAKGAQLAANAAKLSRTAKAAGTVARTAKTVAEYTDPMNALTKPAVAGTKAVVRKTFGGALNPVEKAAIDYGIHEAGVEVPAGAATGNKFVQVVQSAGDHTLVGSKIAGKANAKIEEQMARHGRKLAAEVDPAVVTPETAAESVTRAGDSVIADLRRDADAAYGDFRKAAQDPKHAVTVETGPPKQTPTGVLDAQGNPVMRSEPVTASIGIPVDIENLQAKLKPLYDEMVQWMPISAQNSNKGFTAIKGILESPRHLPAAVAEKALSGLKSLAREAESPDLRNVSQGIGANAAAQLETAIDAAARQAGPDVLASLQQGRAAHAAKMAAAEVMGKLRDEPVQLFSQLTYARDAGIQQLRKVAAVAPGEMTKVGRAYIEQLMDAATAEGGFDKAKTVWNQWQNLGPETKKILFKNPMLVENLNKFFQLGKQLAEQPNPSKSAVAGVGLGQAALIGASPVYGALSVLGSAVTKLLYSPAGVKLLTEGMKAPAGSARAAVAARRITTFAERKVNAPAQRQAGAERERQSERAALSTSP